MLDPYLMSDFLHRERHTALHDYSLEHQDILSFCREIREGLFEEEDLTHLIRLCQSFYQSFLSEHMEREEKLIFTKLPAYHPTVIELKNDHIRIERIFINLNTSSDKIRQIRLLALEPEAHILTEEKSFFPYLQKSLTEGMLETMKSPGGKISREIDGGMA